MAIMPLQLPSSQAITPDITPSLANLVNTVNQGQHQQQVRQTLSQLGNGPNGQLDPMPLLRSGDMSLMNLGASLLNSQTANNRDARNFAFQQQQAQQHQQNADRTLDLQSRSLNKRELPAGFERSPTGGLQPIPGGPADPNYKRGVGDRQNAPAGYKWVDPTNPEAGLEAIPGGPGEKIPAEVAARLGLAKSFLGQLDDYKDSEGKQQTGIRSRIKAGEVTGLIDGLRGAANVGEPGSIRRKISSGAEALLRNLTGAGMSIEEAKKYVGRYEPQWNDSASTLLDKVNQLERELRSVNDVVSKGRGGSVFDQPAGARASRGPSGSSPPKGAVDALRSNPALRDQFEAKYGAGSASSVLGQ